MPVLRRMLYVAHCAGEYATHLALLWQCPPPCFASTMERMSEHYWSKLGKAEKHHCYGMHWFFLSLE